MFASKQSLSGLLKATSRSFYLTLRVLPGRIRPQIGLAYLLARTTDTIADTEVLPINTRLDALQQVRGRLLGQDSSPLNFGEFAERQGSLEERLLLEKIEESFSLLQALSANDQKVVRDVLTVITSGQELDLRRFALASAENIIALATDAELDDYTYRVAGCVGEFWTKICRAHLFPRAHLDEKRFIADGVRFGKGLQLVNILRDLPTDLKKGRCYLPLERLQAAALSPKNVLSPGNQERFLHLYRSYLDMAESHLRAGWDYTNTLPRSQFRLRLSCAWPVLIGGKTIEKLRRANVTQLEQHVKINRGEVRGIVACSVLEYPFPALWRRLFPAATNAAASDGNIA